MSADAFHVVDATMFWSATGGGVRCYLLTKQDWLSRQPGWRHTVAVPGAPGRPGFADLPGIALPGSGGYRLPWRRRRLADVLASLRPDLIEVGDPYRVAWAALDVAQRRGAATVAYVHSNLETMARLVAGPLGGVAERAARAYARRLYERFDLVLVPSEHLRRRLFGWGLQQVTRQPLGVDTQAFHPARADPAWRRQWGLADGDRVLVYAGRFAPEKHLDQLAAAVDRLGAPYRLVAIGAGPCPPHGRRVSVLPFVAGTPELARALASADAFAHAGDQETFGLSVLEALACGTPVIARRAAGLAESVDASVGASVDCPSSLGRRAAAERFAEAIAATLRRDQPALRLAARERAEAHDWQRLLPGLLDHYRRLLPATRTGAVGLPPVRALDLSAHGGTGR